MRRPIIEGLAALVLLGAIPGCQLPPRGYGSPRQEAPAEKYFSTIVTSGIPHVTERLLFASDGRQLVVELTNAPNEDQTASAVDFWFTATGEPTDPYPRIVSYQANGQPQHVVPETERVSRVRIPLSIPPGMSKQFTITHTGTSAAAHYNLTVLYSDR